MKLFSPDAAHWYQRDGQPLHTVLSAKGEPRPTTLRDARKLDLLPSVTNILGVIAKPELTAWLQEQAVMAALTLPRCTPLDTKTAAPPRVPLELRHTSPLSLRHTLAPHPLAPALAAADASLEPIPATPTTVRLAPPLLAALLSPTALTTGAS